MGLCANKSFESLASEQRHEMVQIHLKRSQYQFDRLSESIQMYLDYSEPRRKKNKKSRNVKSSSSDQAKILDLFVRRLVKLSNGPYAFKLLQRNSNLMSFLDNERIYEYIQEEHKLSKRSEFKKCVETKKQSAMEQVLVAEIFRKYSSIMDSILKNSRSFNVATTDHFTTNYGLRNLSNKAHLHFLKSVEFLFAKNHDLGVLIHKLRELDSSDSLTYFIAKARLEFLKAVHRPDHMLGLNDVFNLVYSIFDTDKLYRRTCIRMLKSKEISLVSFLIFRICHKITAIGETPESFFGKISMKTSDLLRKIKFTLELSISKEESSELRQIFDINGICSKERFLNSINYENYMKMKAQRTYLISQEKFLIAVVNTFRCIDRINNSLFRSNFCKHPTYRTQIAKSECNLENQTGTHLARYRKINNCERKINLTSRKNKIQGDSNIPYPNFNKKDSNKNRRNTHISAFNHIKDDNSYDKRF